MSHLIKTMQPLGQGVIGIKLLSRQSDAMNLLVAQIRDQITGCPDRRAVTGLPGKQTLIQNRRFLFKCPRWSMVDNYRR